MSDDPTIIIDPAVAKYALSKEELEEELKKSAVLEWQKIQLFKKKQKKSKSYHQQDIDLIKERVAQLQRDLFLTDPALREVNDVYISRLKIERRPSSLTCPVCGEPDKGNKKNDMPYCIKCDSILVDTNKIKRWLPIIKVVSKK